ncbi:MAG: LysR family transcriptional regulator, partial [Pseudomonadales bacterium]|nr:LysR family transcriptional regulator [Pseudomonadales bacterium]
MEISDLKVFKAVVEEGGVTSAAKKLHRVPSNVTARIQKLENELGKTLFIRDRKRLVISSSGLLLMGYADKILQLADQAVDAFNNDA